MLPKHIKRILRGIFSPLELEDIFPHRIRIILLDLSAGLALILFTMLFTPLYDDPHIRGGFIVTLSVVLWIASLEAYFFSAFSRASRGDFNISYEIAELVYYADDEDLVRGFLFSEVGDEVMKRLGFDEEEIKDLLKVRSIVNFDSVLANFNEALSIERYAKILFDNDQVLANLFTERGVTLDDFVATLRWVVGRDFRAINDLRFWSREKLGRVPSIGKRLAYRESHLLEIYCTDLTSTFTIFDSCYEKVNEKQLRALANIMLSGEVSNAVVVSEDSNSRFDLVNMLAGLIASGHSMPSVERKRVYVLNWKLLLDNSKSGEALARDFASILSKSVGVNIILVLPDFSEFANKASAVGVDLLSIISKAVGSMRSNLIILDSKSNYESESTIKDLQSKFKVLDLSGGIGNGIIEMLQEEANQIEKSSRTVFTYGSIVAVLEKVRSINDNVLRVNKAKSILLNTPREAMKQGRLKVLPQDVEKVSNQ